MKKITFLTSFLLVAFSSFQSFAQTTIYSNNCDNLTDWTNTGGAYYDNLDPGLGTGTYEWFAVTPTIPVGDHTGGGGCFFTQGNDNYVAGSNAGSDFVLYRLESPSIDLTVYNNISMSFWMYLNCETGNWDGGHIETYNGTTWEPVTDAMLDVNYDGNISLNGSTGPTYSGANVPAWFNDRTEWTQVNVDLSSFDGTANFKIRFIFLSDGAADDFGWALDDIEISDTTVLGLDNITETPTGLKLFPNPAIEYIKISGLTKKEDYTIYNILGVKVLIGAVLNNESIDIQNLSNGLYFLKVENEKTIKFIKQ